MFMLRKKQGASMINVLVFFLMSTILTAQIFFFSSNSMEAVTAQADADSRRFAYERYLHEAIETVRTTNDNLLRRDEPDREVVSYASGKDNSNNLFYDSASSDRKITKAFFEQRKTDYDKTGNTVCYEIYDLNYTLVHAFKSNGDKPFKEDLQKSWFAQRGDSYTNTYYDKLNQMAFPSMGENYYLIRVYEKYTDNDAAREKRRGRRLMYQAVVHKNGTNTPSLISFQEVWY